MLQKLTDWAIRRFVGASRTVFAREIDDLQMDFVPRGFGKEFFEILFCLHDVFTIAKAPAFGAAMDVCVYRKSWLIKRLRHDD
jgi:hypothetical protein